MQLAKHPNNPVIPRAPGTFHSIHVANPDLLLFRGRYHLFFRGQSEGGHDEIGVGYAAPERFNGVTWEWSSANPVLRAGAPGAHDAQHVLDPAAIVWNDRVYLYYTAHPGEPGRSSTTGLAFSEDGRCFTKRAQPVISGIAPEAVVHEERVYLFYQRQSAGGCWEVFCAQSEDGETFDERAEVKVFGPSGAEGAFDRFSVATGRIWREDPWYYMLYGGCDRFLDYPVAIGLARSKDLLRWERYPGNPVMERGAPGSWDEGALWFPTAAHIGSTLYVWYEGCGTGMGLETPVTREASRRTREEDYGGYAATAFSQVGMATYDRPMPAW